MRQVSFEDASYWNRTKKTRKQRFLSQMDTVLPWEAMLDMIRPFYYKGGKGRPPIELETMLRIYFLQQWYGYSDPAMEDALYDNMAVRVFARVDAGHAPDETTICKFRHLLERHGLTRQLFKLSRDMLEERGLLLKTGSIVDATIISAPSSTKNQAKQRDPEMKSTKKGNKWYFGMKAHIGTDTRGLVHSVAVTPANAHDATLMDECLHGQEQVIYGDKAYVSGRRKAEAEAQGVEWRVLRKATRKRKLNCADQSFNKKSNRTRARVEHTFGVIKHLWGYRRTRYRGLAKNAAQVYTLAALANFYLARDSLRTVAIAE